MTLSMTAFSRQQQEQEWGSLTWEIRSVNHRYLETSVRLPESFRALENGVREAIRKRLTRGKVECALRFQSEAKISSDLHLNTKLIQQLVQANNEIEQITGTSISLNNMEVLRWPGVIEEQDFDKTSIEKQALSLFSAALDDLVATREREGAELQGFIQQRINSVREIVVCIRNKMPEILAKQ
jgi:uncharacterized protein (TIGR00255 family)